MQRFLLTKFFYPLIGLMSAGVFLAHYSAVGQAVYGDGIGYYAHVRSWIIDTDWDYTNEFTHRYSPENNNAALPTRTDTVQIVATKADSSAENHYTPGMAILILPFFGAAHLLSVLLSLLSFSLPTHGYSDLYQVFSGVGACFYTVLGLWLLEKILIRNTHKPIMARLSVLTIFTATHLFYYGAVDVLNSHFASFFLICLFYYYAIHRSYKYQHSLVLGSIGGLLIANRMQDGVVCALWIIHMLVSFKSAQTTSERVLHVLLFLFGCSIGVTPLVYHLSQTFHSVTDQTYIRNFLTAGNSETPYSFTGNLFHPERGLFSIAPVLLFSLLFLPSIKRPLPQLFVLTAIFFALQYLVISLQGGWYAAAYGGRMYTSSLPFFAIVLHELYIFLSEKKWFLPFTIFVVFSLLQLSTLILFLIRT